MSLDSRTRRLLWTGVLLAVMVGIWAVLRFWLGGYVVRTVLGMAGASEIAFAEVRGRPWLLEVRDLRFRLLGHEFSARSVILERARWWEASLGNVRIDGARVPVTLDGSAIDPWNWSAHGDGGLNDEPVVLPFQTLDLEGELIVRMAHLPDRPVKLKLEGRPKSQTSWVGSLVAEGTGFRLAGDGALLRAGQELDFQVLAAELDLETWSQHIQRLVILPGAPWKMSGKLNGVGEGKVTAKRFAATARVTLRDGRMQVGNRGIEATGADAELEFSDLWKFRTKSGRLRMTQFRVGRLPFHEVVVDFGLWGGQTIIVNGATGEALGGQVRVRPFRYQLNRRELSATVEVENVDLGGVLDLMMERPAELTGRVDGELPLRIVDTGVRLGTGHLFLRAGSGGELKASAPDLLRSGATMPDMTRDILRNAGRAAPVFTLKDLRLEIRAPDLPLGTSARLTVEGENADGKIEFVLPVNGSVEKHLRILP